jgi:hypothetical protein
MNNEAKLFLYHEHQYFRVASYKFARKQVPSIVSLNTDLGSRKLWVRSFAHCFASENVTFDNRNEADHWALTAAQAIIDKALPEFSAATLPGFEFLTKRLWGLLRIARLPVRALDRFRHLMHRH